MAEGIGTPEGIAGAGRPQALRSGRGPLPGPGPARSGRDAPKGRGTPENPPNRFERLAYDPGEADEGVLPEEPERPRTLLLRDPARRVLSHNDSPDVGFDASLNPYRGCEHGCIYCYARPTHEYLGLSAGLDFETRILVKEGAPQRLREELSRRSWRPRVIGLAGVTDAYQPVERRLEITRRCLEVLVEFRNPVTVVTKSALVTRDIDLLGELAGLGAASVQVSITTLDADLQRRLEPRAAHPEQRLRALEALARAGIPAGVMAAPMIPGLNDHELPRILERAADAGAGYAGTLVLRLPHGLAPLFEDWLERHRPERKAKVLSRLRAMRGGRLNDPRFGHRHRGEGPFAEQIDALFQLATRRLGLARRGPSLSAAHFRRPGSPQLSLFGASPGPA